MLSREEQEIVYQKAYVAEHLVHYVQAMSGADPCLHDGYLCFLKADHLIFVGYALEERAVEPEHAYESACRLFQPATVAVISPKIWFPESDAEHAVHDTCYRLTLPIGEIKPDLAYMIRRAEREVRIGRGSFGPEHKKLTEAFIAERQITAGHEEILRRLPEYVVSAPTARLLEARKDGELVAFSVLDLGSASYLFYLFNFRSTVTYVPGASDLLFHQMVNMAEDEGKGAVNLGLGISGGVRRFKEKWGASPFLPYTALQVRRKPIGLLDMLRRLV
ncbi:MAG: hypothetical protein FJ118_11760 [Deltaproteobacteria bacterium]|nr:hypothetical protein [Deltaproteobacteria bacterium]